MSQNEAAQTEGTEPVNPSPEEIYSATVSESDREVSVPYSFGSNLDEAVSLFGHEVVFNRFKAAAVIDLQSLIRRGIRATNEDGTPKYSDDDILAQAAKWAPGIRSVNRKTKADKIKDMFKDMSEEDRAALIAQLS